MLSSEFVSLYILGGSGVGVLCATACMCLMSSHLSAGLTGVVKLVQKGPCPLSHVCGLYTAFTWVLGTRPRFSACAASVSIMGGAVSLTVFYYSLESLR